MEGVIGVIHDTKNLYFGHQSRITALQADAQPKVKKPWLLLTIHCPVYNIMTGDRAVVMLGFQVKENSELVNKILGS